MKRRNKALAVFFVIGCIVVIAVGFMAEVISSGVLGDKDKICKGVTIGNVDVSGMSETEAQEAIQEYADKLTDRSVTVQVAEHTIETSFGALGFSAEGEDVVEQAFQLGKQGNVWKRIKELEHIKKSGKKYTLPFSLSEDTLQEFVEGQCSLYDIKAKNSKLKLKKGKFVATKEQVGHEVQVEETVAKWKKELQKEQGDGPITIEAVVLDTEPKYTREMVSRCQDLIGKYATSFATSTAARASNVKNAANFINGTIIYPGKTFSTIKVIKDRTEANGYQAAPEYSSGKVVDGIGGGVCQVSTTLYNAVINAELEVVERSPHSMVVSYVDVSRDAAISGNYKDFKFKNNTEAPIYIAASAENGLLSFRIYGEETRAKNRKIEFESETLETIQPGAPVETVDPSKPASYRAVTQSEHVGYKARLWKIVYVDGVQTEKIQINSSTYNAEPQYITVGKIQTPKPSATPKSSEKPDASKKPKKTEKPDKTKAPKPSVVPTGKPTKTPKNTPSTAPAQ